MLGTAISVIALGLILGALAVPLIRRRVKPNGLYGLRVPATLEDEHVWYEANARFGRDLLGFGVLLVVLAVSLPLVSGLSGDWFGRTLAAVTVVGAVVLAIVGWRRANRLLAERRSGAV